MKLTSVQKMSLLLVMYREMTSLLTYNVSIIAGADYVGIDKSLLFSFGFDLTQCVHIPILPDDCLELTESFRVSLSASHNGIDFIVDEITVFILEDDGNAPMHLILNIDLPVFLN